MPQNKHGTGYSIGYGPGIHRWHIRRTAEGRMGFHAFHGNLDCAAIGWKA